MTANGATGARRPGVIRRATWDEQYRSGRWDYLHSDEEMVRLDLIARRAASRDVRTVLDLGCGEAPLAAALDAAGYRGRYLGMDWAITALSAAPRGSLRSFVCADLETMPLSGAFDLVVMSEVVYYLRNPLDTVAAAGSLVARDGELLVSLYQPREGTSSEWTAVVASIEHGLHARFGAEDLGFVVSPGCGRAWSVLRINGRSA